MSIKAGIKKIIHFFVKKTPLYNELYRKYVNEREKAYYLEKHTDITTLTPATGYLRKKQLEAVGFAIDCFKNFENTNIRPILSAGNLLGYVRHNKGFIPWDDDLDFKMIRSEYDAFINYCKNNIPVEIYDDVSVYVSSVEQRIWVKHMMKKHSNELFLIIYPEHAQLNLGTSCFDRKCIDFFSIDAYKDECKYDEHLLKIANLKKIVWNLKYAKDVFAEIENAMEEDREWWDENTDNLYYGLDNMESYEYYIENTTWLKKSDVYPLKRDRFENGEFWIPNKPVECVKYVFGEDFMAFPANFWNPPHGAWHMHMVDLYTTIELYATNEEEVSFLYPLYDYLRKNQIYAYYIITDQKILEEITFESYREHFSKVKIIFGKKDLLPIVKGVSMISIDGKYGECSLNRWSIEHTKKMQFELKYNTDLRDGQDVVNIIKELDDKN